MIKGKELLGRPIVAINNGERVDTVLASISDTEDRLVAIDGRIFRLIRR